MQEQISFGEWLRKQRRALDLTRQAFADQVGCAEVTLRRIEAGTLKPSKELASILFEKFGIPDTERSQWTSFARGLSGLPSQSIPASRSSKPITNLPAQITSFIGRQKEQSEVIRLITKYRLVTLIGPGGVGKTRLAIKVGEQVLEDYVDGVWLVELAPILDPLLVPRTTAMTIGLRDEPQRPVIDMLSDYLHEKKMLIILDNCEHLLDACAQLADMLLKRCPGLKILATSREALSILGEAMYPVPSLELPDLQELLEKFREYESVRLFEERAQLTRIDFSLTLENASSVAEICSRLDGIPLAIELAAARVGTFSTEQIAARLLENFSLLTTGNRTALPRHQTLQAAIDWSYDLLSPTEQTLFRQLSVFVNGWTLEAAQSICSDANIRSGAILDLLNQLIHKSLVISKEEHGKTRYRMLETIRQYANDKLVESGESDLLRDRHLEYFLNLAETAEPHLLRTEQLEWLPLLDADYENLRLAFDWSSSKETTESCLNFCTALGWYWVIRCYWLEGLNWVNRALARRFENESQSEKVARARALYTRAQLEWQVVNFEQILASAQESLALASEASGRKDVAIATFYVGIALHRQREDSNRALSLLYQSFAEFQELNEPFWQAYSFPHLGSFAEIQDKLKLRDAAATYLDLARKAGDRLILADALWFCSTWLFQNNRVDEARKFAEESDRLYQQTGSEKFSLNSALLAEIAWLEGNTQKARSLFMELNERLGLLGERGYRRIYVTALGHLAMEEGDLYQARIYFEQALELGRETGSKANIALSLFELSNLFYRQGNIEAFKQNFGESLSLKNYLSEHDKAYMLLTILDSLYFQKPENSARLLSIIDQSERKYDLLLSPIAKRYCGPAETHARKTLGYMGYESTFADG